jgi:nucleoside 2-deoxyribosyltransferase
MLPLEDERTIRVVYLCGPIDGVSKAESETWRTKAYDALSIMGIVSTVPGLEKVQLNSQQIVKLDDTMIAVSDAILVNLNFLLAKGEQRLGTGSLMELGMGFAQRKIIVAFVDGELPAHFKFLRGVYDHLLPSLEAAIHKIGEINEEGILPF